jgi:hypothetical protein
MKELKERLVEIIEVGYPQFNRNSSSFLIRWMSNPERFIGFSRLYCYNGENEIEGHFNPTENEDILFEIINESGEGYIHRNKVIFGEIGYNRVFDDGEIEVCTSTHSDGVDMSEYRF